MQTLTITSCMAQNMDFISRDLADYLSLRINTSVEPILDIPWQERERRFFNGEIDLCWICGLPYIIRADSLPGSIEPLVAPVMRGSRYLNRPIYYSDVIVRSDSRFMQFEDLRGARWACNEPGSHSGYGVVRYALASRGESLDYFGEVVESGAHQNSLQMILRGEVDASAIDSTVLEMELSNDPHIEHQIRIIDTFGPSPIPPLVATTRIPLSIRQMLRRVLVDMSEDAHGRKRLERGLMGRFVPIQDRDYQPIRDMAQKWR
jgi:phosphonate transport system substrate-binding protein